MTAVLTAPSTENHHVEVPAELRAALEQHIRAAVSALTAPTDDQTRTDNPSDQRRQTHLAALAATYPLETVITDILMGLRTEQAEAAAFAGASYAHLGETAGVTRGRAQQMWPTAGKHGKRGKWLKKNQRRVRSALTSLTERWPALGPQVTDQDKAAITAALASTDDLTALDQALRSAQTFLSRPTASTSPAATALQQQIGTIAAAVDADQPLPADITPPAVLEFPGLPPAAPASPSAPAWHGDLPPALTSAITTVLDLFGQTRVRRAPRIELRHHRLEALLGRLRSATANDDPGEVRTVLAILLARPVAFTPDAKPALLDAVRALKETAEVLLTCPTCKHAPERNSHAEERAMHLDFLTYPWLDLVDGQVVQRQHCPACQPSGYSGIDLNCPWCEDGYFLEAGLAAHRTNLPAPVLQYLEKRGWHTGAVPMNAASIGVHQRAVVPPVHATCLASASKGPLA